MRLNHTPELCATICNSTLFNTRKVITLKYLILFPILFFSFKSHGVTWKVEIRKFDSNKSETYRLSKKNASLDIPLPGVDDVKCVLDTKTVDVDDLTGAAVTCTVAETVFLTASGCRKNGSFNSTKIPGHLSVITKKGGFKIDLSCE